MHRFIECPTVWRRLVHPERVSCLATCVFQHISMWCCLAHCYLCEVVVIASCRAAYLACACRRQLGSWQGGCFLWVVFRASLWLAMCSLVRASGKQSAVCLGTPSWSVCGAPIPPPSVRKSPPKQSVACLGTPSWYVCGAPIPPPGVRKSPPIVRRWSGPHVSVRCRVALVFSGR